MKIAPFVCLCTGLLTLAGCGSATAPSAAEKTKPKRHAKITQFYAADKMIPKGVTGKLCYGVENATKVELQPPSEDVWPSLSRCIEISPAKTTIYTLTAMGEDGAAETKQVEVKAGGAPPRIYDLSVSAQEVHPGQLVRVCFKLQNTTKVKAGPGKFAPGINCLNDNPRKTTTYKIVAYGDDRQEDTGTVTVQVR